MGMPGLARRGTGQDTDAVSRLTMGRPPRRNPGSPATRSGSGRRAAGRDPPAVSARGAAAQGSPGRGRRCGPTRPGRSQTTLLGRLVHAVQDAEMVVEVGVEARPEPVEERDGAGSGLGAGAWTAGAERRPEGPGSHDRSGTRRRRVGRPGPPCTASCGRDRCPGPCRRRPPESRARSHGRERSRGPGSRTGDRHGTGPPRNSGRRPRGDRSPGPGPDTSPPSPRALLHVAVSASWRSASV